MVQPNLDRQANKKATDGRAGTKVGEEVASQSAEKTEVKNANSAGLGAIGRSEESLLEADKENDAKEESDVARY